MHLCVCGVRHSRFAPLSIFAQSSRLHVPWSRRLWSWRIRHPVKRRKQWSIRNHVKNVIRNAMWYLDGWQESVANREGFQKKRSCSTCASPKNSGRIANNRLLAQWFILFKVTLWIQCLVALHSFLEWSNTFSPITLEYDASLRTFVAGRGLVKWPRLQNVQLRSVWKRYENALKGWIAEMHLEHVG